jgi:hypothetical protein
MVRHVTLNHGDAMDHAADDGDTIARETLLTPEQAAVLEAAKVAEQTLTDMAHAEAIYGGQIKDDVLALIDAIVALREQEGA